MLIVRAPVRISLAGGGTDNESYFNEHDALVINSTIDKYFYVFVSFTEADGIQITSSDYRAFDRQRRGAPPLWDGDLGLVRAVLHDVELERGIALFLASEVPPGTGLGGSSAVVVALLKALTTLRGIPTSPAQLAAWAYRLERHKLGAPVGMQDQHAAAYGGMNAMTFTRSGPTVQPLAIAPDTLEQLNQNLLLFFTGSTRQANTILHEQQRATRERRTSAIDALHAIRGMAHDAKALLERGGLRDFGALLHESWEQKKRLAATISNARIDELYETARKHGAIGGKIAGAGGGGFMMLYCEAPQQAAVSRALEAGGLFRMDYRFEQGGARVIMNSLPRVTWQRATGVSTSPLAVDVRGLHYA